MRSPAQILERARSLIAKANDEVDRAIAADTLYYAVYYHACEALGIAIEANNKNHERVNDAVFDKFGVDASQRYRALKKLRVRAKYYLHERVTQEALLKGLSDAEAVLEALKQQDAAEGASAEVDTRRVVSLHKR